MEITRINHKNKEAFAKILPSDINYHFNYVIGCVLDDRAVGSAIVNLEDEKCSIAWLWVAEKYRRRGIGSRLLDYICENLAVELQGNFTITYPGNTDWTAIMEYMVLKRGFTIEVYTYPKFRLTKEQLLLSPLMARGTVPGNDSIIPLSNVTGFQIKEFIIDCREGRKYNVNMVDFSLADKDRSMVLLKAGHIHGITLVRTHQQGEILSLDLFYLKNNVSNAALMLLRQTAQAALVHPVQFGEIHFICTDEITVKICKLLMGEIPEEEEEFCYGSRYGK